MLRIIACIKAVPNPDAADQIRIDMNTMALTRGDVKLVMNPVDKNALEAAMQLKEHREVHLTALSMGPPEAIKIVREALALGADEGVLLSDRAFSGADAYATALTLAEGIKKIGLPDLVLCGMASSDGSTEWVGPMLAVFLGIPVVTRVKEIVDSNIAQWLVKSAVENGYRLTRINLPAVLTVTRDLNVPRALSFSGIVKARKKDIRQWGLENIPVSENKVGLMGSQTIVSRMTTREKKRQVEILVGTRDEKIDRLLYILAESGVL